MKKLPLILLTMTPLLASEQSESVHKLSPKFFFKNHREGKEKFTELGVGAEYQIGKEKGLNFKYCYCSNLDNINHLVLNDMEFSWKMNTSSFQVIPYFGVYSFTHVMDYTEKYTIMAHKINGEFGFGFKLTTLPLFQPSIQLGVVKDVCNSITWTSQSKFEGRSYYNPWGGKLKLGVESQFENGNSWSIYGSYAESSHKCYRSIGSEMSFNWRF